MTVMLFMLIYFSTNKVVVAALQLWLASRLKSPLGSLWWVGMGHANLEDVVAE
jgi:hypothetical protein